MHFDAINDFFSFLASINKQTQLNCFFACTTVCIYLYCVVSVGEKRKTVEIGEEVLRRREKHFKSLAKYL